MAVKETFVLNINVLVLKQSIFSLCWLDFWTKSQSLLKREKLWAQVNWKWLGSRLLSVYIVIGIYLLALLFLDCFPLSGTNFPQEDCQQFLGSWFPYFILEKEVSVVIPVILPGMFQVREWGRRWEQTRWHFLLQEALEQYVNSQRAVTANQSTSSIRALNFHICAFSRNNMFSF